MTNLNKLLCCNSLWVHDTQELLDIDQSLSILVCYFYHLFYFSIANIDPESLQNYLKILTTYFTVTICVHHTEGLPELVLPVLVVRLPGMTLG